MKWYGDLGASSFPFSFLHGNSMSPGQLRSDNLFPSILDNAISEIPCIYLPESLWPIHDALYFYHWIHQRVVWTFGSLLSSYLQGNCNPDWAKETSTEEQGAAQAECGRRDHPYHILWNPPSVLTDTCMGIYHVKHWIISARSPGPWANRGHVQKDPSFLIKRITATGTLIKHSYWVTVPPLSPLARTLANTNGIKLLTLSASSTLDFAYLYPVPVFF